MKRKDCFRIKLRLLELRVLILERELLQGGGGGSGGGIKFYSIRPPLFYLCSSLYCGNWGKLTCKTFNVAPYHYQHIKIAVLGTATHIWTSFLYCKTHTQQFSCTTVKQWSTNSAKTVQKSALRDWRCGRKSIISIESLSVFDRFENFFKVSDSDSQPTKTKLRSRSWTKGQESTRKSQKFHRMDCDPQLIKVWLERSDRILQFLKKDT